MSGELLIQSIYHFRNEKRTGTSGGSKRGIRGARVPPSPLLLDQTEAWIYLRDLSRWMTGPLPYLKVWIRHWEPKCVPAFVSGIVTGERPVNYWPTFSPVPSNGPRSLCKRWLVLFPLTVLTWRTVAWLPFIYFLKCQYSARQILKFAKYWKFKTLHVRS